MGISGLACEFFIYNFNQQILIICLYYIINIKADIDNYLGGSWKGVWTALA